MYEDSQEYNMVTQLNIILEAANNLQRFQIDEQSLIALLGFYIPTSPTKREKSILVKKI